MVADERDEIRSRINIVDLVGKTVLLKKAGKSWKGLCPFHADKNPSFTVDPTLGTYRCWSCGEHGDIFSWVMKTRHLEFVEALRFLADMAGVTLNSRGPSVSKSDKARWAAAMQDALSFYREQLLKSENALGYCQRRGLTNEALSEWEIGYAPDVSDALANQLKRKGHSLAECRELYLVEEDTVGGYYDRFRGRLMFPIRNENNDLIAFGGRLLGDGHPKYINSSDTPLYKKSRVLYGMNRAKDAMAKEKRAVLVEGYLDVIACHASGVKCAVASLGTALAEDHAKLLKRWCEQVIILYDSDAAGQKAADRAVEILRNEGLRTRIALMPEGEDPDTLLRTAGPSAVQHAVETGLRPTEYKVRKLLATSTPDQDVFWTQAVEILADASNEMEMDRYVVELAALYPGSTDPIASQNALRREIMKFKRRRRTAHADEAVPRPATPMLSRELHASELAIFRGLLEPGVRQLAWNVCGEGDLFVSELGGQTAAAIRAAFPSGPPSEKPSVWVPAIEPEHVREAFSLAQHDLRFEGITVRLVEDAVMRLRRIQKTRELQQIKKQPQDNERLKDFLNKLKERHQNHNPDAS
ncbi:MAG TPA: DNA primase [Fimbriimonadaceae bacterium]|nr:DNA primase [Fimbriimonadaceae bacterium]